ncbi:MAG: hypothetical protein ACKOC4_07625, partial [Planctomycetia bacterium]
MAAPLPPIMLLTCGDPAGIGPEVAVRAWAAPASHDRARLRIVADPAMLAATVAGRRGMPALAVTAIDADDERPSTAAELLVVRPAGLPAEAVTPGAASDAGGRQDTEDVLADKSEK